MKMSLLFLIALAITSPSQKEMFVGSTTCNEELLQALQIPKETGCEFMKWEVFFDDQARFSMTIHYGISQPNTNGFKYPATANIEGTVEITQGAGVGKNYTVLHLESKNIFGELTLVRMDDNVLHFCNGNGQLLIGNGGYGCALNKMIETK